MKTVHLGIKTNAPPHLLSLSGQFVEDLKKLSMRAFVGKYYDIFPYRERSDAKYNEHHYEVLDNSNAELWFPYKIISVNGKKLPVRERIPMGMGLRRKALISHGLAFRVIFPSITDEHLVFCLMCDFFYNFDNRDKKYTMDNICELSSYCLSFDMSKYSSRHKCKFRIDVQWCKSQGIKPQSYVQHIRKLRTDSAIGELYDVKLSVRENTKILNENGIMVSKSRVGKFKREYGL